MHLNAGPSQHKIELAKAVSSKKLGKLAKSAGHAADATYAVAEIHAYIAIRDSLLAEAEELRTRAKLDSLFVANDYVERCLKPVRLPYVAQCLPEADAVRERQRCQAIKERIAQLRMLSDVARHARDCSDAN